MLISELAERPAFGLLFSISNQNSAISISVSSDDVADLAERPAEVALHVFAIAAIRVVDAIRKTGERQSLQPHAARPGERGKEQAFSTEQACLDASDADNVVIHRGIQGNQAPGVDFQPLPRRELHRHNGAATMDEEPSGAIELLQNEALSSEKSRANLAGEGDIDIEVPNRA